MCHFAIVISQSAAGHHDMCKDCHKEAKRVTMAFIVQGNGRIERAEKNMRHDHKQHFVQCKIEGAIGNDMS